MSQWTALPRIPTTPVSSRTKPKTRSHHVPPELCPPRKERGTGTRADGTARRNKLDRHDRATCRVLRPRFTSPAIADAVECTIVTCRKAMSNGYKPRDNVESDEEYVSEGAKAWLKRQRSKLSSTNGRSQPSQSKADAPPTTTSVKTASQPKSPRKQASKRKRKALGEDAAAAPPSKRVRRQEDSEEFDELDDEEDIPLSKLSQLLKNSAHTGNAPVSKGEKVTIDLTDEVDDEMKPDPDDPLGPIKWFLKCSDLPVRKFLNGLVKGGVTSGQALHQLVRLPASYQDDFLKSIMVGGGWTFLEVQLIKQALCNAQAGTGSLKMKSF